MDSRPSHLAFFSNGPAPTEIYTLSLHDALPICITARFYMKSLIIAEKPSVAADLARALGKIPKKGDHYENDEYVISSAVGHLVELLMPEDIDKKKYGFWRLEMLPIIPEKFELKPIEDSKERFNAL